MKIKKYSFLVITIFLSHVLFAQSVFNTPSKYEYIGVAIDSTIFNKNAEYLNSIFSVEALLNKITVQSEDTYVKEFNTGFTQGFKEKFKLGEVLIRDLGETGEYTFLKSYVSEENEHHLLFRLYSEEGLNYHDYTVTLVNNEPKLTEMYIYLSGEDFSKTLKGIYQNALISTQKEIDKELDQISAVSDLLKLAKVKNLYVGGKNKEALKLYNTLSNEAKIKKVFMLTKIQISSNIGIEEYHKAIDEFKNIFPDDESLQLVLIDGYFLKEEYDNCLATINELDKNLGGDDFLDLFRANTYYAKRDLLNAKIAISRLIENYPNFIDGYLTAISVYIENDEFKEAIPIIDQMCEIFEISYVELEKGLIEDYPDLEKQPSFKDWITKRKANVQVTD